MRKSATKNDANEQKKKTIASYDLGVSPGELREMIVERAAQLMLRDDERGRYTNRLQERIESKVMAAIEGKIDDALQRYIDDVIEPLIKDRLETLMFPQTNRYGEPQAPPQTLREFLMNRAEKYLREEVNYEGKPRGQDSFSWRGTQTRIAHLVHQYLHYNIETEMKNAIANANTILVAGIQDTVKLKLAEIAVALDVKSTTKTK